MKCPVDDTELTMSERQGIEIDYCPKCRGVWLDRGELDKIIERTAEPMAAAAPPPGAVPPPGGVPPRDEYRDRGRDDYRDRGRYEHHHRDDYRDDYRRGHKRRRKSILEELFDFD